MVRGAIAAALLLTAACDRVNDMLGSGPEADNGAAAQNPPPTPAGPGASGQCQAAASWRAPPPSGNRFNNTLSMARSGAMTWNGQPIDMIQLRQYLDLSATLRPTPHFTLEADSGAPCGQITEIVAMAGRVLNCATDCTYRERGPAAPAAAAGAPGAPAPPGIGVGAAPDAAANSQ